MSVNQKRRPSQGAAFLLFALLSFAQTQDQLALRGQQASTLMSQGRFGEAAVIYRDLTKALPGNPGLVLNLGLALHMAGNHAEAVPQFETVLKTQPSSIPALISLGLSRLQLSQPEQAIAPLTKAVALQSANVDARGMLAGALMAVDRAAEAAPHYRKLTELAPKDAKVWSGLGKCYEILAAKSFEAMEKASAEWLAIVADTRVVSKQYRAAFYFYKQALEKNPALRGVHTSIASVYKLSGSDPAWATAEQAKEPKPNCIAEKQACDFMAGRLVEAAAGKSLYWRTRAYNELALRAFAQLSKLPPSVDLHLLRAEIATERNQHLDAAKELEAALKLAPGDRGLEREYAAALYFAKDYPAAIPRLEAEMNRDPRNAEIYFFLGDCYLKQEKPEEAITYLAAAAAYDAKLLPARAALGLALARTGKQAEAIPHLEAALPMDQDGSALYQLSRAYQATGDAEKAKAAVIKYQGIRSKLEEEKRDVEEQVKITPP
jgi:tetratricopeptide (TPR) repeat protein